MGSGIAPAVIIPVPGIVYLQGPFSFTYHSGGPDKKIFEVYPQGFRYGIMRTSHPVRWGGGGGKEGEGRF